MVHTNPNFPSQSDSTGITIEWRVKSGHRQVSFHSVVPAFVLLFFFLIEFYSVTVCFSTSLIFCSEFICNVIDRASVSECVNGTMIMHLKW